MAPKTQQRLNGPQTIEIDPDTGRIMGDDDGDTSELENDQDKLLDDIIGEFGAGDNEISYSASVTRIPKNFQRGQKEPWLFEADATDIIGIRTRLRDVYRGGQFRIRVYKTTSRGKKLFRQVDYSIEPPESVIKADGDAKYDAIAQALERTQTQLLNLADRLSNPTTPMGGMQIDPFSMMEKMSIIMKNMQPNTPAIAHDTSFTMKDGMELFTKGMELAENMRGDGSDSWISVFKEMAKQLPVADILANITAIKNQQQPGMQRRQLSPPPQPRPMQSGFVPPPSQVRQNPLEPNPSATGQQLEQSMRYLIGKAQKNSDPGLYAEWLLDNADKALIRQMANDANVLDQLTVIFPKLAEPLIRAWFAELVEALREILAQMPETDDIATGIAPQATNGAPPNGGGSDAPDTGRDTGYQDNPQDHAGVGEGGPA